MKISFILPAIFGTGGINVVYEYSKRLGEFGHDVEIYAPILAYNMHRGNSIVDVLKQIYATMKTMKWVYIDHIPSKISKEKKVGIKTVWKIGNKYIRDNDVVIATAWCTAFDVAKLRKSKGEKVYFIQGLEIWDNEELGRRSYQLPMKKITIAKWIKDKLVREHGCQDKEIDVVNNGIDCNKFTIDEKEYDHDGEIRCLMLDHTLPQKGVKYGVEAYKKAKKKYPDISLAMFGRKKSNYVPEGAEYHLNPSQDELINLYREADVFIFPSIEEGWGLTPIEAMACKCAVVGSNVACMLDIGKDGENVILCDPKDTDAMTRSILMLIKDRQLREKIAENGYKTVQTLDWEVSSRKLESLLLQLGLSEEQ